MRRVVVMLGAEKQMAWWQKHGFMKSVLPLKQIVDTSFLEAAAKAVAE